MAAEENETRTEIGGPRPIARAGRFAVGHRLGPYMIRRLLGTGGMGEVYDCEDVDSGRRVALKTLAVSLADSSDRARFLREGRLAAALSHPNTIYVFGSDEFDGIPVIAMELASGGTLADRVNRRGALPVSDAIAYARQIISGLSFAAAAGILHRDVKPANCFVDGTGNVKVGDFGLSISTMTRDARITMSETTLGTPAFASPEQMRGDPLDVRSDIYSVGATLYYMIAGHPPFRSSNLMRLLSQVAADAPPDLRTLEASVPEGLASVVARCLAKKPEDRFNDYQSLDAALQPYGSSAVAVRPVRRIAAAVIDIAAITLILMAVQLAARILSSAGVDTAVPRLPAQGVESLVWFIYFSVFEGRYGAGPGKLMLGVTVMRETGEAIGNSLAAARCAIFVAATFGVEAAFRLFGPSLGWSDSVVHFLGSASTAAMPLCLFASARGSNGYLALHDKWTGTRVVRSREGTATLPGGVLVVSDSSHALCDRIGPYSIVNESHRLPDGVRLGLDERLRRHVWVRLVPMGTPALSAERRDLARTTRLRWLGGKRGQASADNWDAYEALDGAPLFQECPQRHSWDIVRRWLLQLSEEFEAASLDGTGGDRRLEDLWITGSQDLRVIDFAGASVAEPDQDRERALLLHCAARAFGIPENRDAKAKAPEVPLPMQARTLLNAISEGGVSRSAVAEGLRRLNRLPATVTFGLRLRQMMTAVAAVGAFWSLPLLDVPAMIQANRVVEDLWLYGSRMAAIQDGAAVAFADEPRQIQLLIAGHLDRITRNGLEANNPYLGRRLDSLRGKAKALPVPSEAEFREAELQMRPLLNDPERFGARRFARVSTLALATMTATASAVGIIALLAVLFLDYGLSLKVTDLAVVAADGSKASRLRNLCRTFVAWSPVFVATMALYVPRIWGPGEPGEFTYAILATCVIANGAGILAALRSPERGWQDRLVGTHLVPR